jgi:hypothetical protein
VLCVLETAASRTPEVRPNGRATLALKVGAEFLGRVPEEGEEL